MFMAAVNLPLSLHLCPDQQWIQLSFVTAFHNKLHVMIGVAVAAAYGADEPPFWISWWDPK
jgi:hypothetical protein